MVFTNGTRTSNGTLTLFGSRSYFDTSGVNVTLGELVQTITLLMCTNR